MNRLVSVVVPAYNSESTLEKCIESLLEQSYHPLEIVLVDDGSTDRTKEIGEHYQARNQNIVFSSQQNQGVSAARNKGVELSHGEWIAFVDSDDYVLPSYIQSMVDSQKKHNSDWVIGGSVLLWGTKKLTRNYPYSRELVTLSEMESYLETWYSNDYVTAPWGKLYSSELIKSNKIKFPLHISNGEDTIFNIDYVGVCNRISMVYEAPYVYVYRPGSLSGGWKDIWRNQDPIYSAFYNLCEAKGYTRKAADRFFVRSISISLNFAADKKWNMKRWVELCQDIQKNELTSELNLNELGLGQFYSTIVRLLRRQNFRFIRLLFQIKKFMSRNLSAIYQKIVSGIQK